MRSTLPMAVLLAQTLAPEKTVPVEEEPRHLTVLKNDFVQAFRVTLEPGESTLTHVHSRDDAAVRLSEATVRAEVPGQPAGAPEAVHPGQVSARANEPHALTHRVSNIGTTRFDVVDVQILRRPEGPATPPIAAPAAENPQMRVYRYELAPGAVSASHAHRRPYLVVAATDMDLRMTSPDGGSVRHTVKAGDLHWVDAQVTHTLGNEGKTPAILVEFELK